MASDPTSHKEGFLPSPSIAPPHPSPPLPSQILPEQGLLWQPSPKYSRPSGRAEEAEEPKVTESNPGYCCLRLAACHWLCLMRRCGSRAPPPPAVREAGTRAQSQGPGSLGAPASCAGKAGSPVPWPQSLDQRPQPGPSPGAGGILEGGGPRGKGSCVGGAGTVGRALKALKAGDQVWAPLGQEGAHLSLDGPEMKGVCPPPPQPPSRMSWREPELRPVRLSLVPAFAV